METQFTEIAIRKSETVIKIFKEEHPFKVTWSNYLQLVRIENVEVAKEFEHWIEHKRYLKDGLWG